MEHKSETPSEERELVLETNRQQSLDLTVKSDLLLLGDFGTVFVNRTCFYNRPVRSSYNSVSVEFFSNGYPNGYERPTELSQAPVPLPALTSVSVIRILKDGSGFMLVKAEYEASGEMATINGTVANGKSKPPGADVTSYPGDLSKELAKYGIPPRLSIDKGAKGLPPTPQNEETMLFVKFYDFGKLIQQDQFRNGTLTASKWLQPSVTEEERTIGPECDARFRQQRSMGLPTTGS